MIYLSGATRPGLEGTSVGLMVQPRSGLERQLDGYRWWAADTGCYAQGERFVPEVWCRWLGSLPRERCLFATAPDVVGDMQATLERSEPWLQVIRDMGYRAALVAQDGAEQSMLPWAGFDVLFIGGTTSWKLSPAALGVAAEARQHGLPVHMGRVNSLRRLRAAALMGCSSADGTYLAYRARANGQARGLQEILGWLDRLEAEPFLDFYRA